MIHESREWKAKISELLYDGIVIREAVEKHPFQELLTNKEHGKIRDSIIFKQNKFKIGDIISIKLTYINEEELDKIKKVIDSKNSIKWISVVYSIDETGFYTKEYDKNEDRFKKIFMYKYRTYIADDVYLNNRWRWNNNPFEIGDVVQIEVKKL